MKWPRRPAIYEVNTWVWLDEVSRRHGRAVGLGEVPPEEWDALTALPFDAVWLMGVWERSPCAALIAADTWEMAEDARRALADLRPEDVVGSPYAVHRYRVDDRLGGPAGLAAARAALAKRGTRLILDYVPNHTAVDHPWVFTHPERFVQGRQEDLRRTSGQFFEAGGLVFSHAKGPGLAPWPDTAQLNAFRPEVRLAAAETLRGLAGQCDGVRCDMAMLLLNDVFARTWGEAAGDPPTGDFWEEVIPQVRASHPDFLFVAEVYWALEWELLQRGFDFAYDKRLYDRLLEGRAGPVGEHLVANPAFQEKLVRFTENHDELRAAAAFPGARLRAAALAAATLPGAKLFHEGQLEGRVQRVPVTLARRPEESPDEELRLFYRSLVCEMGCEALRDGEWRGCPTAGWPDNQSHRNLLAWCWRNSGDRRIVVVNFSDSPSQGLLPLPWEDLGGGSWRLTDAFSKDRFERNGDEMRSPGLYVALGPWGYHLLRIEAT